MKKTVGKRTITAAAVIAALGLGFGSVQIANADPTTEPNASASQGANVDRPGPRGHRGTQAMRDGLAEALATKLGLDATEVSTALDAVRTELGRPERGTRPSDAEVSARQAAEAAALAEKLGVSAEKVTTALSEIRSERLAERRAADDAIIDQAVADGTVTADEAAAVRKAVHAGVVGVRGGGPRR